MCVLGLAVMLTGCCCSGGGYPTYYQPGYGGGYGGVGGACPNGACGTGVPQGGYYPQGASVYGNSPAIQAGVTAPVAAGYAPQTAFYPLEAYPRY